MLSKILLGVILALSSQALEIEGNYLGAGALVNQDLNLGSLVNGLQVNQGPMLVDDDDDYVDDDEAVLVNDGAVL